MQESRDGPVLGLDYGSKRIGVAVSDPDRGFVFPRPTLQREAPARDLDRLRAVVAEEAVTLIALGLPLNADGSEGAMCRAVRDFQAALVRVCGVPVVLVDERYTSLEADERLRERHPRDTRRRRAGRDQAAAALILRSYLDDGAYEAPLLPGAAPPDTAG